MPSQNKLLDMSPDDTGGNDKEVAGISQGYPTVHLEHHHLKKLGLHGVSVGDKVMVHALAHVVSHSQHENEDGEPTGHMSMDLHKMSAEPQEAKIEEGGDEKAAKGIMDQALKTQGKRVKGGRRPPSEP